MPKIAGSVEVEKAWDSLVIKASHAQEMPEGFTWALMAFKSACHASGVKVRERISPDDVLSAIRN